MNDWIDRDALLESLPKGDLEHDEKISKCGAIADAVMLICDAPSVDAVSVVRCKDCYHFPDAFVQEKGFLICPASGMDLTEDDFCSYGERRNDDAKKED